MRGYRGLLLILAGFSLWYGVNAWLADDAYITFRVIENFHNGYGLRWNIQERIQVYTHPLWMLLLLVGKYIVADLYCLSLLYGYIFSVLMLYVAYLFVDRNLKHFSAIALIFFASKCFMDFTSSGLENSLSYLLIALFFYVFYKREQSYLALSLILSLMFLTRMDLLFFFLPLAAYVFFYQSFKLGKFKQALVGGLLGFVPVVIWILFSLYYYGSFFPNSVIAKTNIGVDSEHVFVQGWVYLGSNISADIYSFVVMCFCMAVLLKDRAITSLLLLTGTVLYVVYLINVGGDYMYGRFISVMIVFLLFAALRLYDELSKGFAVFAMVFFTCFLLGKWLPAPQEYGIVDEKHFYYGTTGLLPTLLQANSPIEERFSETSSLLAHHSKAPIVLGAMGFNGYLASQLKPDVYIVDKLALTSAYLAAYPMSYGYWRPGHYERIVTPDYLESLGTNENRLLRAEDRYVFEQVELLSKAPLNDSKRWQAIVAWNFGKVFDVAKSAFASYPKEFHNLGGKFFSKKVWDPNGYMTPK